MPTRALGWNLDKGHFVFTPSLHRSHLSKGCTHPGVYIFYSSEILCVAMGWKKMTSIQTLMICIGAQFLARPCFIKVRKHIAKIRPCISSSRVFWSLSYPCDYINTMKSKPVQVLPPPIQSEDPVLTSTCFYCGLGGQGFDQEGTNHLQKKLSNSGYYFENSKTSFF